VSIGLGARLAIEHLIDVITDPTASTPDRLRADRVLLTAFAATAPDAAAHEDRLRDLEARPSLRPVA
jgi:hypothetical protein